MQQTNKYIDESFKMRYLIVLHTRKCFRKH